MNWNYQSETTQSTGYEEHLDLLKEYTCELYANATDEEKEEMIERVFDIYRSKNIFPIVYYNEDGVKKEIKKCVDKSITWNGDVLDLKFNQGQSLCRYLFPNMTTVDVGGRKNNTMFDRFNDDHKLKRAIEFCFKFDKDVRPNKVLAGLRLIGGGVATNFKTMNAKALYERYCPEDGTIYDFACGFGGRMLGALSSKKNFKYFGAEPNTQTYNNLNVLGNYIEQVVDRENIFKIYKKGSEDLRIGNGGFVDFAFSSPPYFNLEQYSNEESQCYIKYPTIEEWFEGYVKRTISNIHHMLKIGCFYAVNIADFNIGNERIEFVDRWIKLSEELGFEYVEQIHMKLATRRGVGHKEDGKDKDKNEGIFVFRKN